MPLSAFHPLIADWFRERVGAPTAPQREGWPLIQQGRHTLIAAPTGSGKTLAAFLCCLDRLLKEALAGSLPDRVDVLYVSPLKALSSDVRKNLETPLHELRQRAEAQGLEPLPIRVGLRTGDTPPSERQAMLRRPPHILVTTPESLYLCLTSRKARATLRAVRTVIIDEIHALVRDKRGAHLSLSLERLDALCQEAGAPPPCRVGLSATQRPIEEVARFLVGAAHVAADGAPDCHILDGGHLRALDLQVCLPKDELSSVCSTAQWSDVHDQIASLVLAHRTTLIFVSTRRLCERTAHSLVERLGEDAVCAHHGSMSRRLRQSVEERLKNGQLKAVVATASLELGIDIGAVDLVCQIGSPRAIATLLQRVGRANHRPAEGQADLLPPKGRLFALTRDELVECAALLRAIRRGEFDRLTMPHCPLDVLAQQITALCAVQPWDEDALFALCRRAHPFRDLCRADFDQVVGMLSEGVATRRGRGGAHLHRDAVNRTLRGRRGALLACVLNGGTIPEPADFEVVAEPVGATVGRLDEEWVAESSPGDIFLLGTTSWRVRAVQGGKVHVEDAHGAPPSVPFWAGEAPGRTFELSQSVSELRAELERRLAEILAACPDPAPLAALAPAVRWLEGECAIERRAAEQMAAYLAAARAALGRLPTQRDLIAERFFDEGGGMQLVLHMPLGARINRAFGLALRKRFCRSFNFELQAAATDDGVILSLGETHSFPIETVWQFLRAQSVEHVLSQAVLGAPVFGPHFRWTAQRALAVPRRRGDGKVPPQIVRMYTEDLLAGVFPAQAACPENLPGGDIEIPDHPLVRETLRECLRDVMDIDGLIAVLRGIEAGEVTVHGLDTPEPSLLSHQLLNAAPYAFLDDTPLEERRARAVSLRRGLPAEIAQAGAGLDPQAIAQVRREAWPVVRDDDELHDALLTLHYMPADLLPPGWEEIGALPRLIARGRATVLSTATGAGFRAYVPSERAALVRCLFGAEGRFDPAPPEIPWPEAEKEGAQELAALCVVRGWMMSTGPWSDAGLARALGLPQPLVEGALLSLEAQGQVLRGRFTPAAAATEFCDRRLLSRIHRLTTARLRREIEPVSVALFMRFLTRWQHVLPATRLSGQAGLRHVLAQLQGFEACAAAWEEEILPSRLSGYDPAWLDALCLSGELAWGRLRPTAGESRRGPTRAAPISLWLRESQDWLVPPLPAEEAQGEQGEALSPLAARVLALLARRGALFLPEICAATASKEEDVLPALGELVSHGRAAADSFAGLRRLLGGGERARPGQKAAGTGRWSLLYREGGGGPGEEAAPQGGEAVVSAWARLYLRRWGVLCRDLCLREGAGPSFGELLPVLRVMEARGQVRGGRFVAGLGGEQFALPEAVEGLRALRRHLQASAAAAPEEIDLAAADPLNLIGTVLPGQRVPVSSAARVRLHDGVPQAQAEAQESERSGPDPAQRTSCTAEAHP